MRSRLMRTEGHTLCHRKGKKKEKKKAGSNLERRPGAATAGIKGASKKTFKKESGKESAPPRKKEFPLRGRTLSPPLVKEPSKGCSLLSRTPRDKREGSRGQGRLQGLPLSALREYVKIEESGQSNY